MKEIKQTLWVTFLKIVALISVLLLLFSEMVSAESGTYTMSLCASSESVAPGDTIQLAVQVHNDGWPDSGEAEVAAFQATLDYDHDLLEYVSIEVPEGTIGDFSPERSMILGYGEGHSFQETLDCAVLTMKVSENAEGDIPIVLSNAVIGKSDATPLNVSSAGTLTLYTVGETAQLDDSGQSLDSASAGIAGNGTGTGESGNSGTAGSGTSGTEKASQGTLAGRSAQAGAEGAGAEAAAGVDGTESPTEASGKSSVDGSVSEETNAGESGNGENTAANAGVKDQTTENAEGASTDVGEPATEESGSAVRSGIVLAFLLAAVAAAGVCMYFYRKWRRK